jgi:anti-sigma regulatory factor (Ser/Thr protein kinase)
MSDSVCICNRLEEIERVQTHLTQLLEKCDCHEEKVGEICLITEELLVNIISHGFEPGEAGEIKVHFSLEDDKYCLEFHDQGKTFNPLEADDRPDGKVGGWGIPLVTALSDHIEYSSDSGTNVLRVHISKRDNHG